MPTPHHSFFTGRMPFLPPNQQRQSTEGTKKQKTDKKKQTENKNFEKTDSTVSKTFLPHA